MEELTYHTGMLRVGETSEDFAEPITDDLPAENFGMSTVFQLPPAC